MATPIQIVNKALSALGTSPINDFDDQSKKAEITRNLYPLTRDRVLEDADWTFATKRKVLIPAAEKPEWGFAEQYRLPNDCIRVIMAVDNPTNHFSEDYYNDKKWAREGQYILTQVSYPQLYIKYIFREEDTSNYSPYFVETLAYALAADLCIPLTENASHQERLLAIYDAMLDTGAMKDGSQGSREELKSNRLQARR